VTFNATKNLPLATTITGSLPRPGWFDRNLDGRTFLSAFAADPVYREQYADAVAALVGDQLRAGLDVLSDGEMRFDQDIGGRSWSGYVLDRLAGVRSHAPGEDRTRSPAQSPGRGGADIFREVIRGRSEVVGPLDAGALQYDAVWKTAQRLTSRPIKMGSCSAQLLDLQLTNRVHAGRREAVTALSQALNAEYHRLADAGCRAIQIEEPALHNVGGRQQELSPEEYVAAFNIEVSGLRAKTEVWCHICWGNPFAQRLARQPTLTPILPYVDGLDVDVVTFETAENGGAELPEIAAAIGTAKKVAIGVVRHRSLQIETPDEVAALIRTALRYIEADRLILSSDCGFGRQGMSRVHAFYKMVALVRGTNIVRRELGIPEADVPATDDRFAL
jgi:5-methyltetrahydropteroyltriglutamate--homocysteine methyltransferase